MNARNPADFFTCTFPDAAPEDTALDIIVEFKSRRALDSVEVISLRVSEIDKVEPIPMDIDTTKIESSSSIPIKRIHRWVYIDSLYRPTSVSSILTFPNLFYVVDGGLYEMECFVMTKSSLNSDTVLGYRKALRYEFTVDRR